MRSSSEREERHAEGIRRFHARYACAGPRLATLAGAGVAIAAISANALAAQITDRTYFGPGSTLITFETHGDGTPVVNASNNPLIQGQTLTMPAAEYSAQGVIFDRDINWVNDGGTLFDGAVTLSALAGQGGSPILSIPSSAINTFTVQFTTPVDAFGFFAAQNDTASGAIHFQAYDATNTLVDDQTFGGAYVDDTLSNANTTVSYGFMGIARTSGQNPITHVVVTKNAAILDDLVFTPIPAPTTIGVLGAAGVIGLRRRRHIA